MRTLVFLNAFLLVIAVPAYADRWPEDVRQKGRVHYYDYEPESSDHYVELPSLDDETTYTFPGESHPGFESLTPSSSSNSQYRDLQSASYSSYTSSDLSNDKNAYLRYRHAMNSTDEVYEKGRRHGSHEIDRHVAVFCHNRASGFYCDPADSLNIVHCPSGELIPCEDGRFCATVGRVPDCYQCEAPFDMAEFCERRGPGTHCAPWWTGSAGVISCPSGLEIPCPRGSSCKRLEKGKAMCAADDAKNLKGGGNRFCPPATVIISRQCASTTGSITRSFTAPSFTTGFSSSSYVTLTTTMAITDTSTITSTTTNTTPNPIISAFGVITFTLSTSTTVTSTGTDTSTVSNTFTVLETPQIGCFSSEIVTKVCDGELVTLCRLEVPQVSCQSSATNNAGESYCMSFTSAYNPPDTTTITFTTTETLYTTSVSTTLTCIPCSTSTLTQSCSSSFSIYGCFVDTICPDEICSTVTVCDSFSLSVSQCPVTITTTSECSASFSVYGCIVDTICPDGICSSITVCESYSLSLSVCLDCPISISTTGCTLGVTEGSEGPVTTTSCGPLDVTVADCCLSLTSTSGCNILETVNSIGNTSIITTCFEASVLLDTCCPSVGLLTTICTSSYDGEESVCAYIPTTLASTNACSLCPTSTVSFQTCQMISYSDAFIGETTLTLCTSDTVVSHSCCPTVTQPFQSCEAVSFSNSFVGTTSITLCISATTVSNECYGYTTLIMDLEEKAMLLKDAWNFNQA